MNISDLYDNEFYEEKEKYIVDKIATFIKRDGFDISSFSLFSVENYIWKFISDNDINKGFLLFYDPQVVNEPIPQYQLYSGCVYVSFDARNITEAYIQHNKSMSDEDYKLLSISILKEMSKVKETLNPNVYKPLVFQNDVKKCYALDKDCTKQCACSECMVMDAFLRGKDKEKSCLNCGHCFETGDERIYCEIAEKEPMSCTNYDKWIPNWEKLV